MSALNWLRNASGLFTPYHSVARWRFLANFGCSCGEEEGGPPISEDECNLCQGVSGDSPLQMLVTVTNLVPGIGCTAGLERSYILTQHTVACEWRVCINVGGTPARTRFSRVWLAPLVADPNDTELHVLVGENIGPCYPAILSIGFILARNLGPKENVDCTLIDELFDPVLCGASSSATVRVQAYTPP